MARRVARVVLFGMVALAFVSCAPSQAGGPKVLLIGDSLLNGSREQVTSTLSAEGWIPTIEAEGGTTITYWADRVQFFQAFDQPDIVVIELGTNDCSIVECFPLGPYIDQIMSSVPSSNVVMWLNVQEDVPPPFDSDRDFVNRALTEADQRWPNMYLVDLNGHVAGHPEWHNPDGLHFNDAGKQEFARFLADELERFKPA